MQTRRPAVAGRFYPGAPDVLHDTVQRYVGDADVSPQPDRVMAVIAPHAGYPYSGATAGHAFRRLLGMRPRRVVILGPSHYFRFPGLSIANRGQWETPLGAVPIDEAFADRLVGAFGTHRADAHDPEHALEVELPFLQHVLGPGFSIVPVLLGGGLEDSNEELAAFLARHLDPGDLVVASTDLSHFLSESEANVIDRESLGRVVAGDPEYLRRGFRDQACSMCGAAAVLTALRAANLARATDRHLWDYRTSGRASGDSSRVVGYGGLTLERPPAA